MYRLRWWIPALLMGLFLQWPAFRIIDHTIISRLNTPPVSEFSLIESAIFPAYASREDVACTSGVDIIFVHGLGSNPDTTWGTTTENGEISSNEFEQIRHKSWIEKFLPDDLPTELLSHTRVFFYNYDSYWYRDALETRLWGLADRLLFHVGTELLKCNQSSNRRIIFVAFSYGGLVVKQALVRAKNHERLSSVGLNTEAVIFLGTPHRGSDLTQWGHSAAKALRVLGSNPFVFEGIQYDALPLRNLHTEFIGAYGQSLGIVNFFEERPTRFFQFGFLILEDFVVRQHSATFDSPGVQNIGLSVDHSGLNKFTIRSTDYKLVLRALTQLMEANQRTQGHRCDDSILRPTVPTYIERKFLSTELEQKLRTKYEGRSPPHSLVIHGLGGCGKSQLALRYIETHRGKYSQVFWIESGSKGSIYEAFRGILKDLQLPVLDRDARPSPDVALKDTKVVRDVLKWFRKASGSEAPWLVVMDNADDLSWGLRELIPVGDDGTVLITSRNIKAKELITNGDALYIGNMDPDESVSLLLQSVEQLTENPSADIVETARSIAALLDYLPLALDLARAYIADLLSTTEPAEAFSTYLKDFQSHRNELLGDTFFAEMTTYEKTVRTVWDTSFDMIEKQNPNSTALLILLSFFQRDHIPKELFRVASLGLYPHSDVESPASAILLDLPPWLSDMLFVPEDEDWDSFEFRRLLRPLLTYSMVQPSNVRGWGGVTIHGLVQWRAQQIEMEEPWLIWAFYIVVVGSHKAFFRPVSHFRFEVMPHVLEIVFSKQDTSRWKQIPAHCVEVAELLHYLVAEIMIAAGRWEEALAVYQFLFSSDLTAKRAKYSPRRDEAFAGLSQVALRNSRDWDTAEKLLLEGLDLQTTHFGKRNVHTLTIMENLAINYQLQGRFEEAEKLLSEVVEFRVELGGNEDAFTLASLVNLSGLLIDMGRWNEALEISGRVKERLPRSAIVTIFQFQFNAALLLSKQGRFHESTTISLLLLESARRELSKDHYFTISVEVLLISGLRSLGQVEEAEERITHVLNTRRETLQAEHPDIITAELELGAIHFKRGELQKAATLMTESLSIGQLRMGIDHPKLLYGLSVLAAIYESLGQIDDAEELLLNVVETKQKKFGLAHSETILSNVQLGLLYANSSRWMEAEVILRQSVLLGLTIFDNRHGDIRDAILTLMSIYYDHHALFDAVPNTITSIIESLQTIAFGLSQEQQIPVMKTIWMFAEFDSQQKPNTMKAIRETLEVGKKALRQSAYLMLRCLETHAKVYKDRGNWEAATDLQEMLLALSIHTFGERYPGSLRAMADLGTCLLELDQFDEAGELLVYVMELRKTTLGEEEYDLLMMLDLAYIYNVQRKYSQAEALLLEVVKISGLRSKDNSMNKEYSHLASTYLRALYERQGRINEAKGIEIN